MAESGDQEQSTVSAAELAANITSGGIDVTPDQDGGVLKEIKRAGSGFDGPCPGDTVRVHYVGTLLDGTQFDSSRDRGEKFEFKIGKGQVIKAWDMGVATMKRGELAVLTCKSQYAYGDHGSPPKIPGKATLVFEVELFDWKGMTSLSVTVTLSCNTVYMCQHFMYARTCIRITLVCNFEFINTLLQCCARPQVKMSHQHLTAAY